MAIDALLKLANRIETKLKSAKLEDDVDAFESYPGDSMRHPSGAIVPVPISQKISAAKAAALEDVISITRNYELYQSQLDQAQKNIHEQKFLYHYARELQTVIDYYEQQGDGVNFEQLDSTIKAFDESARSSWPSKRSPLSELGSLRILRAIVKNERGKSEPQIPITSILPNTNKSREDFYRKDDELADQRAREQEAEELTQRRPQPTSTTMRSRMDDVTETMTTNKPVS